MVVRPLGLWLTQLVRVWGRAGHPRRSRPPDCGPFLTKEEVDVSSASNGHNERLDTAALSTIFGSNDTAWTPICANGAGSSVRFGSGQPYRAPCPIRLGCEALGSVTSCGENFRSVERFHFDPSFQLCVVAPDLYADFFRFYAPDEGQ
jgi:hypothetical protein